MFVRFECPNGHKIKVDEVFAGRTAACPTCQATTVVPRREPNPLTESGCARLLDECELEAPHETPSAPPLTKVKQCPRCDTLLSRQDRICGSCRCIVATGELEWRETMRAASRFVRGR